MLLLYATCVKYVLKEILLCNLAFLMAVFATEGDTNRSNYHLKYAFCIYSDCFCLILQYIISTTNDKAAKI